MEYETRGREVPQSLMRWDSYPHCRNIRTSGLLLPDYRHSTAFGTADGIFS
jgi:hypothetical protein